MSPNPHEIVDLVTFTDKVLSGKLHFLCSEGCSIFDVVTDSKMKRKTATLENYDVVSWVNAAKHFFKS